tara:strand:- start:265 stop:591 length:327 start_codon:yes stop_codon:yes gene_type:complete
MANAYRFLGKAIAASSETTVLTSLSNETIIIQSIRVTNNTGNTPTISFDVNDSSQTTDFTIINTKSLTANNSEELLTKPLVLESADALKATVSSTDSIHIGISYLSIT